MARIPHNIDQKLLPVFPGSFKVNDRDIFYMVSENKSEESIVKPGLIYNEAIYGEVVYESCWKGLMVSAEE